MKIAILNCLKANDVCAGASCLKAFNTRTRHFEVYGETPLELTAFARCSGCEAGVDDGFTEKLERIVSEGSEVCHVGVCTKKRGENGEISECPVITKAAEYLEAHGVRVVRGTH